MTDSTDPSASEFAPVVIKLLRGVMFDDDKLWNDMLQQERAIVKYLSQLGLQLKHSIPDGYAFLTQPDVDEDLHLPRLVRQRALTYESTLLLIILRECLEEFDHGEAQGKDCFITDRELIERIQLFFQKQNLTNISGLIKKIQSKIGEMEELKFLKPHQEIAGEGQQYIVRRLVRGKVTLEMITQVREQLEAHHQAMQTS